VSGLALAPVLLPWVKAFAFTQAVEVPLYLRVSRSFRTAFLASALTHPIVWFVFPALWPMNGGYWPMVAAMETFAVVAEALWLKWNGVPRAFLWAFLVNMASATLGLVSRALFGVP
jgi:hypothetical protein